MPGCVSYDNCTVLEGNIGNGGVDLTADAKAACFTAPCDAVGEYYVSAFNTFSAAESLYIKEVITCPTELSFVIFAQGVFR